MKSESKYNNFRSKNGFKDVVCEALTIFPGANELSNDLSVISDKSLHSTASKVHGAYMGPTWGRQDPGGPHVGPMNLAIRAILFCCCLGLPGKNTTVKFELKCNQFLFKCQWVTAWLTSVNWVLIGSDNGLSPVRQAITWTMLTFCKLDPLEQISVKFESKHVHFHSAKCNWKCRLRNPNYFFWDKFWNVHFLHRPPVDECLFCVFCINSSVLQRYRTVL